MGECASVRIRGRSVPNLDAHLAGETTRACSMLKKADLLTSTSSSSASDRDVVDGFGEWYIAGGPWEQIGHVAQLACFDKVAHVRLVYRWISM